MAPVSNQSHWVRIQHKAFARWINIQLETSNAVSANGTARKVANLQKDLSDGVVLNHLIKELSRGRYSSSFSPAPKNRIQYIDNISCVLNFLKQSEIHLHNIGAEDIYEGNLKLILGLVWALILNYTLSNLNDAIDYSSMRETLLRWCQLNVKQFDGMVSITDFSASWNNGIALCALLSALRPDLIDFHTLDLTNRESNTKRSIALATKIGIPQLIDCEDLLIPRPDEKAVITYLVGWYEKFNGTMTLEKLQPAAISNSKVDNASQVDYNVPRGGSPNAADEQKRIVSNAKVIAKSPALEILSRHNSRHDSVRSKNSNYSSSNETTVSMDNIQNNVVTHFANASGNGEENDIESAFVSRQPSLVKLSEFKQRWINNLANDLDSANSQNPIKQHPRFGKSLDNLSHFSFEDSQFAKKNTITGSTSSSQPVLLELETKSVSTKKSFLSLFSDDLMSSASSLQTDISNIPIPRRNVKRNRTRRPAPILQSDESQDNLPSDHNSFGNNSNAGEGFSSIDARGLDYSSDAFDVVDNYYEEIQGLPKQADVVHSKQQQQQQQQPPIQVEQFRNMMVYLAQVLGLKKDYERRSKIYLSNIRTQIYKWNNLISYNELYDLEELEYEKQFLQNSFQNIKKSILVEKNNLYLIFAKINTLLKALGPELHFNPPPGCSLTDLTHNWQELCTEEKKYIGLVEIKLETLKQRLKENYLDTLKVINNKFFKLKADVADKLYSSVSLNEQVFAGKELLHRTYQLNSLLINIKELHQLCIKYNVEFKGDLLTIKIKQPVQASTANAGTDTNSVINPFDFSPSPGKTKSDSELCIIGYDELVLETKLLHESVELLLKFSCKIVQPEQQQQQQQFDLSLLNDTFDAVSHSKEYITKKEFRSLVCTEKQFDKQFAKSLESCLPIHSSRQGYNYSEFISSVSELAISQVVGKTSATIEKLLDPPVLISRSNTLASSIYSDVETQNNSLVDSPSPMNSPESVSSSSTTSASSSPYTMGYNSPASVYDSEESMHHKPIIFRNESTDIINDTASVTAAHEEERTLRKKNLSLLTKATKFPSRVQLPMNFTIVYEEKFST